jgi:hypothetical protein
VVSVSVSAKRHILFKEQGCDVDHVSMEQNCCCIMEICFRDQENTIKQKKWCQVLCKSRDITLVSCTKPEVQDSTHETRNKLAALSRGSKKNILEAVQSWSLACKRNQHTARQPIRRTSSTYNLYRHTCMKEHLLLIQRPSHTKEYAFVLI